MTSVLMPFYAHRDGATIDMYYDDGTMMVTSIHAVVPAGSPPVHLHIVTQNPTRTFDQTFNPVMDQHIPPQDKWPITISLNPRGDQMTPHMPWLVAFGVTVNGA